MQINGFSTNKAVATVRTRNRSSTGRNAEMLDWITVLSCDLWLLFIFFSFFFCVRLANVRDHLALYPYWLDPARPPPASPDSERGPHVTTPGGGERGGGEGRGWCWHHISAALAVSARSVPHGKGRTVDWLARLTALSQWALRNGRGNENQPQVGCTLPPSAGRASREAILNAYSAAAAAAAAVRVAVMCLKVAVVLLIFRPHSCC